MKYEAASERRKRELADALKKLIQTKPLSKITVSELIKTCGINRNTFYYHFDDIYALLKWTLEQEAFEVVKQFDLINEYEDAIRFAMDYIDANDKMLNNIYHSVSRDELKRFFYTDFYEIIRSIVNETETLRHISVPESYKDFICHFYTEAVAGVLLEWIITDKPKNREQMIHYISTAIHDGIISCMSSPALDYSVKRE